MLSLATALWAAEGIWSGLPIEDDSSPRRQVIGVYLGQRQDYSALVTLDWTPQVGLQGDK